MPGSRPERLFDTMGNRVPRLTRISEPRSGLYADENAVSNAQCFDFELRQFPFVHPARLPRRPNGLSLTSRHPRVLYDIFFSPRGRLAHKSRLPLRTHASPRGGRGFGEGGKMPNNRVSQPRLVIAPTNLRPTTASNSHSPINFTCLRSAGLRVPNPGRP